LRLPRTGLQREQSRCLCGSGSNGRGRSDQTSLQLCSELLRTGMIRRAARSSLLQIAALSLRHLTPELSRATARPQTRTNMPKKIAAVKWHRLERIVRPVRSCGEPRNEQAGKPICTTKPSAVSAARNSLWLLLYKRTQAVDSDLDLVANLKASCR